MESQLLAGVRAIALALPDAYEEQAWVGTRWRVRGRTFAHLLTIEDGRPEGHARAAGTAGPCRILTFRSSGLELETLRRTGPPFFAPPWRGDGDRRESDAAVGSRRYRPSDCGHCRYHAVHQGEP